MVEWFDETVGQLLDHLDRKGLRDNTIVVYVADNGWIQSPDADDAAADARQDVALRRRHSHAPHHPLAGPDRAEA